MTEGIAESERSAIAALRAAGAALTPASRAGFVDLAIALCEGGGESEPASTRSDHRALMQILNVVLRELDRSDQPIAAISVNNAIIALGGEGLAPNG